VLEPSAYQAWLSSGNTGVSTAEAGRMLFEQLRCNSCHQGGGITSRGPPLEDLLGRTVQLQGGGSVVADENYIRESILRPNAKVVAGYQPIMPSFEGQIDEAGLLQLIAEIKSLSRGDRQTPSNGEPGVPPAEDGAEGAAAEPMPGTDRQERTSPQ
jgi:cytochrome c oxidase subunit 2